jgi:hypothetical protein
MCSDQRTSASASFGCPYQSLPDRACCYDPQATGVTDNPRDGACEIVPEGSDHVFFGVVGRHAEQPIGNARSSRNSMKSGTGAMPDACAAEAQGAVAGSGEKVRNPRFDNPLVPGPGVAVAPA